MPQISIMRISFDIDDTLMMHGENYLLDKNRVPLPFRLFFKERLRKGSYQLFQTLQSQGHEICIYTTSSRSQHYIRWWFKFYGVKLELIVNQAIHQQVVKPLSGKRIPSKNPRKFGIDLHIDDLQGVAEEAVEYDFNALIISPKDDTWCERILNFISNQKAQI